MSKSVVRRATLEDVAVLATLVAEVQELHVASRPDTFKPLDVAEVRSWLCGLFENASVAIWIAEQDAHAQGYLVLVAHDQPGGPFSFERSWIELDQIGVRAPYRRSGVARALVEAALAHAASLGIRQIELTSWSFNQSAHAAFRKLGFIPKVVRFELERG